MYPLAHRKLTNGKKFTLPNCTFSFYTLSSSGAATNKYANQPNMTDTIWVDLNKGVVTNLGTGQGGRSAKETRISHLNKLFFSNPGKEGTWTVNYNGTQNLIILYLIHWLKNIGCFLLNHDRYFVYHNWEFTLTYHPLSCLCLNINMNVRCHCPLIGK